MRKGKRLRRRHLQKAVNHNRKLIHRLNQVGFPVGTIPGDRAHLILHHLYRLAKENHIEIEGR